MSLSSLARIALVGWFPLIGAVGALNAADLEWKPLVETNRAPASVAQPVACVGVVVAVRGDEQLSAGCNVRTFAPGMCLYLH